MPAMALLEVVSDATRMPPSIRRSVELGHSVVLYPPSWMTAVGYEPKFQSARCEGEFRFQSGPLSPWVRFLPDSFGCTLSNGRGLDGVATGSFGRVGMWRGGGRIGLSVSAPFVWRCLISRALAPFPHLWVPNIHAACRR